jgi:NAD(P)-dependent dehydrogenase (short-subunit alcohol dehydrogenase family)
MERIALVTGASSGIGRCIAARLAAAGYTVYGTSRQPKTDTLDGFHLIPLDVTDTDSATRCVATVLDRSGKIDVLVNNAGVELVGALEETGIDQAQALFETNFFGLVRMVNAVLPGMRAQRSGVIINISSIGGLGGVPFDGFYAASKHAVEGYTESLWYEVEPFNIRVALIEPGYFRSAIHVRKVTAAHPIADYDRDRQRALIAFDRAVETGPEPDIIAERALAIADGRARALRHIIGPEGAFMWLKYLAPDWLVRQRIRWLSGLDDGYLDATRVLPGPVWVSFFTIIALLSLLRRRP